MHILLTCIFLLPAVSATAQTPIPRQGDSCPTGTYKSGDYCKPIQGRAQNLRVLMSVSDRPDLAPIVPGALSHQAQEGVVKGTDFAVPQLHGHLADLDIGFCQRACG